VKLQPPTLTARTPRFGPSVLRDQTQKEINVKKITTCTLAVGLMTVVLTSSAVLAAQSSTTPEAQRLSKKQVKAMVANATTPEDQLRLAAHFESEAARMDAEAAEHDELAKEYRRNPLPTANKTPMSPRSAEHCEFFAKSARDAAKAARDLAAEYRAMAEQAKN
jgi:hypothetical protein